MRHKRPERAKTCPACGVVFHKDPKSTQIWKNRVYCSRPCAGTSKDETLPSEKICVVCGLEFSRKGTFSASAWRRTKCCSLKCGHALLSNHGGKGTREYRSWTGMKDRCRNPNSADYSNYGGRGITVCPEWVNGFAIFLRDMGPRPEGTTLERKNVNLGYSPDNCKWAGPDEQANNRRNNIRIAIGDTTQTLEQWSRISGVDSRWAAKQIKRGIAPVNVFSHSGMLDNSR